ncbi:hypothetical protein CEXT_700611 [Caerostris extrusa]|uniref:Uncharacterized protein n=1 Tax=Caerostris extrusa TaxID=172846 RepID=A0AAV4XA71_CAEEX|nr:hypothetical protein CEXT_700611 [Caerostris extrusa]
MNWFPDLPDVFHFPSCYFFHLPILLSVGSLLSHSLWLVNFPTLFQLSCHLSPCMYLGLEDDHLTSPSLISLLFFLTFNLPIFKSVLPLSVDLSDLILSYTLPNWF